MVRIGIDKFYICEEDLSELSHCTNPLTDNQINNSNGEEIKMNLSIKSIQYKINSIQIKKQELAQLNSEIEVLTKEVTDKVELLDNLEQDIDNQISEKTKELEGLKEISERLDNKEDTDSINTEVNDEEELENVYSKKELIQICQEKDLKLHRDLLTDNSVDKLIIEMKSHIYKIPPDELEESLKRLASNYKWYRYLVTEEQRERIQDELELTIQEVQDIPF